MASHFRPKKTEQISQKEFKNDKLYKKNSLFPLSAPMVGPDKRRHKRDIKMGQEKRDQHRDSIRTNRWIFFFHADSMVLYFTK